MSPTPNKDEKPTADISKPAPGTIAPDPEGPAEGTPRRPPIADFFEALGVKKGAQFKAALLVGGEELSGIEIVGVAFCAEPVETVLIITESGRSAKQLIQWKHVVALKV